MRILQIMNDYCHTKVHSNLCRQMDSKGVSQFVFTPVRDQKFVGANQFDSNLAEFAYPNVVRPYHKYFYHLKRNRVFREAKRQILVDTIDVIYASTLLTDGGVAYKLWRKYNVPYFVAVRNTDVNLFFKKAPHTWGDARRILLGAKRIVFVSEALKSVFLSSRVVAPIIPDIESKIQVIPNGIDDYYVDHVCREGVENHKIIYVGNFRHNKNVWRLIEAVASLRDESDIDDVSLTLVGGGQDVDGEVQNMVDKYADFISYLGPITDKAQLSTVFREHAVFAMPSLYETFGLVYVEAYSQGLALLYTQGQGIDGTFDEKAGISVNPYSVDEIKESLKHLLTHRVNYTNRDVDFECFRWSKVADAYLQIAIEIVKE